MKSAYRGIKLLAVMKGEFTDQVSRKTIEYYKVTVLAEVADRDKPEKINLQPYELACNEQVYLTLEKASPLSELELTVELSPVSAQKKWFKAVDGRVLKK